MSIFDVHLKSGEFDHGYLLVGDFEESRKMAQEAAKMIFKPKPGFGNEAGLRLLANPDFFYQKFELFGIEESRNLKMKASQRAFGEKKVFIIELNNFSFESANALLKTMEEPYSGTYFFILIPSLEGIPRTLVSRLTVIDNGRPGKILDEEKTEFYKKFLADSCEKRLETVKKIEEREEAINFLNELELVLKDGRNLTETKVFSPFNEIQRSRELLFSQGSSAKMVLEHIALSLPRS